MRKLILLLFLAATYSFSQNSFHSEKLEILKVLLDQEKAWNNSELDNYMNGYWNSDSLRFIGSKGISYGWQTALKNYKSTYPDTSTMGKLKFDIISVEPIAESKALVIGKWNLTREKGNVGGYFTLLLQKLEKSWRIILDHTS